MMVVVAISTRNISCLPARLVLTPVNKGSHNVVVMDQRTNISYYVAIIESSWEILVQNTIFINAPLVQDAKSLFVLFTVVRCSRPDTRARALFHV